MTRDELLDSFVEGLRPQAHKTAGVPPVTYDISMPPADLRALAADLLDQYDALLEAERAAVVPVLTPSTDLAGPVTASTATVLPSPSAPTPSTNEPPAPGA